MEFLCFRPLWCNKWCMSRWGTITGLIYSLSGWAAPALVYSWYWLSCRSSLRWLLMLCWWSCPSCSIAHSSQNSSQRMWALCHWSQSYLQCCQNLVNLFFDLLLKLNALAKIFSQVTFSNSLTLLHTLVMFCTVHSMTVMTSREPHLKCVKKPIMS